MEIENPYEIFGLRENVDAKEIRNKYKHLSRIYHPDRPGGDKVKMQELIAANAILSDEYRRSFYDKFRHENKIVFENVFYERLMLISTYKYRYYLQPISYCLITANILLLPRILSLKRRGKYFKKYIFCVLPLIIALCMLNFINIQTFFLVKKDQGMPFLNVWKKLYPTIIYPMASLVAVLNGAILLDRIDKRIDWMIFWPIILAEIAKLASNLIFAIKDGSSSILISFYYYDYSVLIPFIIYILCRKITPERKFVSICGIILLFHNVIHAQNPWYFTEGFFIILCMLGYGNSVFEKQRKIYSIIKIFPIFLLSMTFYVNLSKIIMSYRLY